MTRSELLLIAILTLVTTALLAAAWKYRDLPALDERVAPMRGGR